MYTISAVQDHLYQYHFGLYNGEVQGYRILMLQQRDHIYIYLLTKRRALILVDSSSWFQIYVSICQRTALKSIQKLRISQKTLLEIHVLCNIFLPTQHILTFSYLFLYSSSTSTFLQPHYDSYQVGILESIIWVLSLKLSIIASCLSLHSSSEISHRHIFSILSFIASFVSRLRLLSSNRIICYIFTIFQFLSD